MELSSTTRGPLPEATTVKAEELLVLGASGDNGGEDETVDGAIRAIGGAILQLEIRLGAPSSIPPILDSPTVSRLILFIS